MPVAELVRLAQTARVAAYTIGLDRRGQAVLWKLRFADGAVALFVLAPAVATRFTIETRKTARRFKWPKIAEHPDAPAIEAADWDMTGRFITAAYRALAAPDGIALALEVGPQPDIYRAFFLPPAIAVGIADLLWEAMRARRLTDLAGARPSSARRH